MVTTDSRQLRTDLAGRGRRLVVGSALVYSALILFCAFGLPALSSSTQVAVKPYFWLFGPPANLVHGTAFLLPFFLGTLIAGALIFGIARSHSLAVKRVCGFALLMAWSAFGFIAYAPGA